MDEVESVAEVQEEQPANEVSENTEVAPQDTTNPEEAPQPKKDDHEDRNDRNWRRANEQRKRLEKELRTKDEQLNELLKAVNRQTPAAEPIVDEFADVGDEDFIPKGKVSKLIKREAQAIREEAKKEVLQELQKREQLRWKDRITAKYPDFEDVVNLDTLDLLEQQDPELAETIAELKDPYKVGIQSYKYIKALGLGENVGAARRNREVDKKIEENAKTVSSPQVYDKRPLAQAYKVTETERKALYAEMMGAAGQTGFGY